MTLAKSVLLVAFVWLLAATGTARASYLCTVNCVYAGEVTGSNAVGAIIDTHSLDDVLGAPTDPTLGVVLAQRDGSIFSTPTTSSTLTVMMSESISGDGYLWITGDEEFPPSELNEIFKVFVSATGDFSGSGDSVDLGSYYYNAYIDLSGFLLPTEINYVKLQANPGPSDVDPAPMTVLGIAGEAVTAAVPLPAAVWLFGSGVVGLLAAARRR